MKLLLIAMVVFIVSIVFPYDSLNLVTVDPDTFRNVSELITSNGYPVENYIVETEDGYLLPVERIPYGKKDQETGNRSIVFLMHAFLCSSDEWVLNFPHQSLGFILADEGYDVWLGNIRGNIYSRQNVGLSPNQSEFWNFSFDEMAKYDVPAMVDFILNKTGRNQLNYIGHSQGTTVAFALLSENPDYNKKIKFVIALAPVTQTEYVRGLLGLSFRLLPPVLSILKQLGFNEFFPHSQFTEMFSVHVCGTLLNFICGEILNVVNGRNDKQLNFTRLPVYFNHILSGTSINDYVHYAQILKTFQKFDYDWRNPEVYGQHTPPRYDISKITTPVALISAINDKAATPEVVGLIPHDLHSMVDFYVVPDPNFNHGDFVISTNANSLVYKKVLSLLDKYGKD